MPGFSIDSRLYLSQAVYTKQQVKLHNWPTKITQSHPEFLMVVASSWTVRFVCAIKFFTAMKFFIPKSVLLPHSPGWSLYACNGHHFTINWVPNFIHMSCKACEGLTGYTSWCTPKMSFGNFGHSSTNIQKSGILVIKAKKVAF